MRAFMAIYRSPRPPPVHCILLQAYMVAGGSFLRVTLGGPVCSRPRGGQLVYSIYIQSGPAMTDPYKKFSVIRLLMVLAVQYCWSFNVKGSKRNVCIHMYYGGHERRTSAPQALWSNIGPVAAHSASSLVFMLLPGACGMGRGRARASLQGGRPRAWWPPPHPLAPPEAASGPRQHLGPRQRPGQHAASHRPHSRNNDSGE